MYEDYTFNNLNIPLPKPLIEFIKHEYPEIGAFLISTIEFTVKDSTNHYSDILRSVEPLLKDKTKAFVQKLFMYKKKPCREGAFCRQPYCLYTHDDQDPPVKKVSFETPGMKKIKNLNNEVVFNRVDESKYNIESIREYAVKYGTVSSLRRLNRGKYLIIYEDADAAQEVVESSDFILNDRDIKKFYNVIAGNELCKKFDVVQLLQEQKELIDKLLIYYDVEVARELQNITLRIRNYVLSKENRGDMKVQRRERFNKVDSGVETSLYSNLFTE